MRSPGVCTGDQRFFSLREKVRTGSRNPGLSDSATQLPTVFCTRLRSAWQPAVRTKVHATDMSELTKEEVVDACKKFA